MSDARRHLQWLTVVAALLIGLVGAPAQAAMTAPIPAPGSVWTAAPTMAIVPLPAGTGGRVTLLNTTGNTVAHATRTGASGPLRLRLPALTPGLYTLRWQIGNRQGGSTFTIWHGGTLPPRLQRAAYGGPTARPARWLLGLLAVAALAGGAVGIGSLTGSTARRRALQRRALVFTAVAETLAAVVHSAAAAGIGPLAILHSPLLGPLLTRGVALDALLAAALAAAGAVLAPRLGRATVALAALAEAFALLALPAVQGGGPGALALAWIAACSLGLFAGAWPHLLRAPASGGGGRFRLVPDPAPALRTLAAIVAVAVAIPLWLHWHPLGGTQAWILAGSMATAALLGRPGARRRRALRAATVAGLAGSVLLAPALGAAAAAAGRPHLGGVAWPSAQSNGQLRLRIAPLQAGVNVIQLVDPGATAAMLPAVATNLDAPGLTRHLQLQRSSPGRYVLRTAALSIPGHWRISSGAASFGISVPPQGQASSSSCRDGFTLHPTRVAHLPGPVVALTTNAGDGAVALAATPTAVYATADGGQRWTIAGRLSGVRTLAIGRYGTWYAGGRSGLLASHDGGVHWRPAGGIRGAVQGLAMPLYPPGVGGWAVAGNRLYVRHLRVTNHGTVPLWSPAGTAPAGLTALLAIGAGKAGHVTTTLVGAGQGLWQGHGGGGWQPITSPLRGLRSIAASQAGIWVLGRSGIAQAATGAGPWHRVSLGAIGRGGQPTALATTGSGGTDILVGVRARGLLLSRDAGAHWSLAGCPGGTPTAIAGTYSPSAPPANSASAPLAYIGDAAGNVAAIGAAVTPHGRTAGQAGTRSPAARS